MSLLWDVEKLKSSPLPEVREKIAERISNYFNESVFDDYEVDLACEVLRLLAKDIEVGVRRVLAENLKSNDTIPHDIIMHLAQDATEVALPVLEFSEILTDEDLISIVKSTGEVARLTAIASRKSVSEIVTGELVDKKMKEIFETLAENKGARMTTDTLMRMVEECQEDGNILEKLVHKGNLPASVAEKLIHYVSDAVKNTLMAEYHIDPEQLHQATEASREYATINMLQVTAEHADDYKVDILLKNKKENIQRVKELIDHLYRSEKLTYSIVLRSLCEGNITFFEVGLSRLAGASLTNTHTLVWDKNPQAFKSIYTKAKMPESALSAVEIVLSFVKQEIEINTIKESGFKQRMIERIVTNGYDRAVPMMPYILSLIASGLTTSDVLIQ